MAASEPVDPRPFDLGPRDARAAVLCLHGLTGTPYEVRPLAEAFAARGMRAFGPALPGHAATVDELAKIGSWTVWSDAARAATAELADRHERVFAAGLSMGGLLALLLASERAVDALVVVGVPLRLAAPIPQLVAILEFVAPMLAKSGGSDIQDEAARRRHPSYDAMPLASVHELTKLQRVVRGRLRQVVAPILVAHGARDRTADPADARRIHAGVSSREREILELDASGHVVPVDHDGPRLAEAAAAFLAKFLPRPR
ncbi:Thermostable monoacylglycerol lipase [Myxococcaceae bacterium]|nr:Thermostable monoacylglycerol lipase [Myxococcaceae bacterium]